jgi:hypothetical protein
VSTASTDLLSALAGVSLSDEEKATLQSKLQAAADKKLGDLLQVRRWLLDMHTVSIGWQRSAVRLPVMCISIAASAGSCTLPLPGNGEVAWSQRQWRIAVCCY